jgi:hypothetical protein
MYNRAGRYAGYAAPLTLFIGALSRFALPRLGAAVLVAALAQPGAELAVA